MVIGKGSLSFKCEIYMLIMMAMCMMVKCEIYNNNDGNG